MPIFNKAPLPFLGQKRNFIKILNRIDFSDKIVIDLFGGSGLLSHTIKQKSPSAKVIYNDFDNYFLRLKMIKETESLRLKLFEIMLNEKKNLRISTDTKEKLIEVIKASSCNDWLTLSSWLLFSGNYAHSLESLIKSTWYMSIAQAPLSCDGYLDGVERVQYDFRDLFRLYENQSNVIFIADPPYTATNQEGYSSMKKGKYFGLRDSIDCIKLLHKKQALLFSSAKSETHELLDVWKPKSLSVFDYNASIGCGNRSIEKLYFLNWQGESVTPLQ